MSISFNYGLVAGLPAHSVVVVAFGLSKVFRAWSIHSRPRLLALSHLIRYQLHCYHLAVHC